jgi:hypothetical protein
VSTFMFMESSPVRNSLQCTIPAALRRGEILGAACTKAAAEDSICGPYYRQPISAFWSGSQVIACAVLITPLRVTSISHSEVPPFWVTL